AIHHLSAHHFPDRRLRALAGADSADGDIAIGDHADQSVVLADRQHPGVDLRHEPRGIADCLIWVGDLDVAGHCFIDLHGMPPRVSERVENCRIVGRQPKYCWPAGRLKRRVRSVIPLLRGTRSGVHSSCFCPVFICAALVVPLVAENDAVRAVIGARPARWSGTPRVKSSRELSAANAGFDATTGALQEESGTGTVTIAAKACNGTARLAFAALSLFSCGQVNQSAGLGPLAPYACSS